MAKMTQEEYAEWFHSELIGQLVDSERFQKFVKMNYDISQVIDDSTKEARIQLIEVPHEIVQERIQAEAQETLGKAAKGIQIVGAGVLDKLPGR